jgi:hypothetical protein
VLLRRHVLDREIALGVPPAGDAARAVRAQQLVSPRERRLLASELVRVVAAAEERNADPASPLRLNHVEVLAARDGIIALVAALRSERAVGVRGIALARVLVDTGDSPLFCSRSKTVREEIAEILRAL